ncbi:MAG: NUDIX domain-containing protein [Anaerolineales bacterium]|jgi:ADP-ribose pyrophosphatase
MPPQPWKTLSTREIYKNKWMSLHEDIAELPNGQRTVYGVCEFGECVGVLPFIDDQNVLLVRQYRYVPQENHRWEMPTGGIHPGETPEQAAQRELMEEGGYCADQLTWISTYYPSKSICHETAHLYIGRNLAAAKALPDETEFFERAVFPFDEVLRLVETSEIRDSMTVIAVLHAARLRAAEKG